MRIKQYKKLTILLLGVVVALTSLFAYASEMNQFGETYAIKEEDFLDYIYRKLNLLKQNGELEKIQNQFKEKVISNSDRPTPLTYLTRSTVIRSYKYDPSITVPYDLKDLNGRIFAQAGTTINPLQYIAIHKVLLFINGEDEEQIKWAINQNNKLNNKIKLVLVNGSISKMEKIFKQPIYFDQSGRLTSKFNIKHVPAEVKQDGLFLKITEVAI